MTKNVHVVCIMFIALVVSHATSSANEVKPASNASSTAAPTTVTPEPTTHSPTTAHPTTTISAKPTTATPTSHATSKPVTTVDTGNMTTSNKTTNGSSVAPPSTMASTTSKTTMATTTESPYGVGTWPVIDSQNTTCMMMSFKGTIALKDSGKSKTVGIPVAADASESSCGEDDQSDFKLSFDDAVYTNFSVKLQFFLQDQYTYLYSAEITKAGRSAGSEMQVLFQTPVGKSYQCDEKMIRIGEYNLTLSSMKLQPFSKKASDKMFGNAYSCNPSSGGHGGPNAALITGLVLSGVIVILLGALWYSHRKKQPRGRGYANFT